MARLKQRPFSADAMGNIHALRFGCFKNQQTRLKPFQANSKGDHNMLSHGMKKQFIALLFIPVCFSILFSQGCTTNHQIFKYKSNIDTQHRDIIPGVEPEEASDKIMIVARGKGVEPENGTPMQRKLLAERAAVIDGYRQLTERLAGVLVNYYSESGKNTVSYDQIMIEANAYLRGAQITNITYENGFATANVKVYIVPRETKFYHKFPPSQKIGDALIGTAVGVTAGAAVAGFIDD